MEGLLHLNNVLHMKGEFRSLYKADALTVFWKSTEIPVQVEERGGRSSLTHELVNFGHAPQCAYP